MFVLFRLRINWKTVGYCKWYSGEADRAEPKWLYSKDLKTWSPNPIFHRQKDMFTGLFDKNGEEIFWGDSLIINNGRNISGVTHKFGAFGILEKIGEKDCFFPFADSDIIDNNVLNVEQIKCVAEED